MQPVINENYERSTKFERVVKRGEIYYIHRKNSSTGRELDPKGGRPAVIISHDNENFMSGTVEVAYLTSRNTRFLRDTQFRINTGKLRTSSVCKTEQIDTVDKNLIGDFVCSLTESEMENLDKCLLISIGISDERVKALTDGKIKELEEEISRYKHSVSELDKERTNLRESLRKKEFDFEELKNSKIKCESKELEDVKAELEKYKTMYQSLVNTLAGRA